MIHAPNVPTAEARRAQLRDAARSLEAMVLKQLVTSSGVFGGGEGPGAAIRGDLFASTLADALAKGGGVGLAAQLERSMAQAAGLDSAEPPAPAPPPLAGSPRGTARLLAGPSATRIAPHQDGVTAPLAEGAGRVSSGFGVRADPFTGRPRQHDGVDVAAPEGTGIRAVRAGRVVFAGPRGGYGNAVELDHGDGDTTLYGHASDVLVRPGQVVEGGELIAHVGSTGRATGPHLHFEVRHAGRPKDPARALNEYRLRADGMAGAGSRPRALEP